MRRISFKHTAQAVLERRKTVTRRTGWATLEAGDRLLAVDRVRCRAEDTRVLGTIEVVNVWAEQLDQIAEGEIAREGFDCSREEFIAQFCRLMKCEPSQLVRRIEFRYVDEGSTG